MEGIFDVPYGADGMGIGEQYPVADYGTPSPDMQGATWGELNEAGFDRPDPAPAIEIDGEVRELFFYVLRDAEGQIVATWDEGRWWTPAESAAFTAVMASPVVRRMAEATASLTGNRAQRRRRRKQ